jgi:hypothetical protein
MSTEIGSFGWDDNNMANSRGNELVAARATVGLAGLKRLHPGDAHRHPVHEHVITLGVPRSVNGLDSGLFRSFLGVFAGHRCERSVRRIPRVPGLQVSANPDPSKNRTPGQPTVQLGTTRPNNRPNTGKRTALTTNQQPALHSLHPPKDSVKSSRSNQFDRAWGTTVEGDVHHRDARF